MEWQLIATAPTGVSVRLGRWRLSYGDGEEPLVWDEDVGTPWEENQSWFSVNKRRNRYQSEYTHWRALPPPPTPE